MFIGGTHTEQFDNVLKSKHGLSVQNRELTLIQCRAERAWMAHIIHSAIILHLSFDLANLTRMLRYGHCRFHCVSYQCILLFHSWPWGFPDPDLGIRWSKKCNISGLKNHNFKIQNCNMFIVDPLAFQKDVQATGETSSPQKRTSSTAFTFAVCHFCPSGSGSGIRRPKTTRIRIHNTDSYNQCFWYLYKQSQTDSRTMFVQTTCPILQQTRRCLQRSLCTV